jgi:hypothetical protein
MSEDKSVVVSSNDNSCDICHKGFQSKTHLTRHKNRKNPCKPQYDAIDDLNPLEIFDAIKHIIDRPDFSAETMALIRAYLNDKEEAINESNLVNKIEYKCGDCGMEFAHRQSRDRHIKLNSCSMKLETTSQEPELIITNTAGNILTDSNIQYSNVAVDASITNNITNYITNHITNNITLGVNPFGLESIEHITLKDFKYIFSDTSTLIDKLCNLVFNRQLSNISFYKYNLNKQIISFLSKNMEIERIDEKDFVIQFKRLLEDTCILLFYQYREHLNKDELIKYMKKLVEYQDSILYDGSDIMNKNTKNCILRLMDFAFRNKDIKHSIEKIIKDLKTNPEAKKIIKTAIYAEEDKRDDIINEYYYRGRNSANNTNDNTASSTENPKLLYKLRTKAIESNKKDDKARTKRITESVFENVNFDNAD